MLNFTNGENEKLYVIDCYFFSFTSYFPTVTSVTFIPQKLKEAHRHLSMNDGTSVLLAKIFEDSDSPSPLNFHA